MSSMRDMFVGIYFQDEASKDIDKIDKKMDEAERTVMGLGTKLGKTSSGFSSMGKVGMNSAASVSNGMNQSVQSVGKLNQKVGETGRGFGRLKDTIIGVGTAVGAVKVIDKAMSMVKGAVDGAINRVDTLAGFPVVMEKMGFTSEQATGGINKLADGIQGLPTTLDGIVASTQNISLMTGDLDKATDTALTLNNAFLASGSDAMDAERGLDQYVKMLSKGKVEADSWSTLQETMGFALNKTASAFGFTGKSAQQDLYKALQKGKITFDQFNNKLIDLNGGVGGFAEIAKDGSAGIGTSFTNMNTKVTRGVAGIIQINSRSARWNTIKIN
ncbi:tape measure protein [Lysinibacillus sp. NPDC092081]|uniref:tape measure protein n=1 Tax=Lysinibacillus sp. NPDC092081 TaxID=3364131 RepID=UPI003814DC20